MKVQKHLAVQQEERGSSEETCVIAECRVGLEDKTIVKHCVMGLGNLTRRHSKHYQEYYSQRYVSCIHAVRSKLKVE